MEEEKKLPKNIRQMAEKEERVRVYLEDYAYTFIHKLACTSRVRTGVLLGSRMIAENKRCWFVKGAVELVDELDTGSEETIQQETSQENQAYGSKQEKDKRMIKESNKETNDNQVKAKEVNNQETNNQESITQQIWETTQSVIQEYFPGCSICGWFICGSEENFPDGEQLKKTHRQIFSGENCLMYWKKGDEESFWIEEEDAILHLKGYFVYYEKNPEMQNYMLSRKEEASEDVDDEAALNFRKIMKEKQDTKHAQSFKHQKHPRHLNKESVHDESQESIHDELQNRIQNGLWVKVCAAVLVGVLVGGGVLLSRGIKKKEDSVQALAVGASVERQSGEFIEGSLEQESQSEDQIQSTVEANMQLDAQSKSQTENQVESQTNTQAKNPIEAETKISDDAQMQAGKTNDENSSDQAKENDNPADKKDVSAIQDVGIFSGDMVFYKDGLGASVYRITDKSSGADEKTQQQTSDEEQPQTENSDGQSAETQNINSQNAETQNSTLAASENTQEILTVEVPTVEAAVNRPASYTVQPGDTLIEISRKFYGSSQMVMQIKEANGLDDINKIYIGQELTLP